MCGFVGFVNNEQIKNKEVVINQMAESIAHRGPDSEGYYLDECVALGFRRLSIIGLEDGHQPLENREGNLVLVFNGEIYRNGMCSRKSICNSDRRTSCLC